MISFQNLWKKSFSLVIVFSFFITKDAQSQMQKGSQIKTAQNITSYSDGRPSAKYRLDAKTMALF